MSAVFRIFGLKFKHLAVSVITLTSDIGLQDYLVGAIKGMLIQNCPDHQLIDISHDIMPFNFPQAVYICKSAIPWFPAGSFHFMLVNLFVKHPESLMLCRHKGHYFFSANNGLLPMVLGEQPEEAYCIALEGPIHTLDIVNRFTEIVAALHQGAGPEELGPPVEQLVQQNALKPFIQDDYIEGQIIYIDRFENVIVNITKSMFERSRKGRSFRIYVMRDDYITRIHENYADVPEGSKVALFNTAGYLEIAINKGNAAGLFGLQSYSQETQSAGMQFHKHLFYQTVRIHFA